MTRRQRRSKWSSQNRTVKPVDEAATHLEWELRISERTASPLKRERQG